MNIKTDLENASKQLKIQILKHKIRLTVDLEAQVKCQWNVTVCRS